MASGDCEYKLAAFFVLVVVAAVVRVFGRDLVRHGGAVELGCWVLC